MTFYYDENFGAWEDMDDPDMVEFYNQVQRENVWKNCVICGRAVKLRPDYDKCNGCCTLLERGGDPDWCDPEDYEPLPEVSGEAEEGVRVSTGNFDDTDDECYEDFLDPESHEDRDY